MQLSPHDIEQKVFSVAHLGAGYAKREVDHFLDLCRDELERAQAGEAAARAELRRVMDQQSQQTIQLSAVPAGITAAAVPPAPMQALGVGPAPVESSITKILQRGQQLADEAVAEAKVEAERLKAEAQVELDKLKADAVAEAERLKAEAAAELQRLQAESQALASANATSAKILQNALAVLAPPAAPPTA